MPYKPQVFQLRTLPNEHLYWPYRLWAITEILAFPIVEKCVDSLVSGNAQHENIFLRRLKWCMNTCRFWKPPLTSLLTNLPYWPPQQLNYEINRLETIDNFLLKPYQFFISMKANLVGWCFKFFKLFIRLPQDRMSYSAGFSSVGRIWIKWQETVKESINARALDAALNNSL